MTLSLTQIIPDPRSKEARRDLSSAVGMHHRLMSLFPDGIGPLARTHFGALFRVEDTERGPRVLLQSHAAPDLGKLPDGYGQAVCKDLAPVADLLRPGLTVQYRCVANPIRKPGKTTRETYNLPAVVPLSGRMAEEWWERQAEAAGMKLRTLQAVPLDAAGGERGSDKSKIRLARTRFDGTAEVIDEHLLRSKLLHGIGQGKAYGCGLLSLAPQRMPL